MTGDFDRWWAVPSKNQATYWQRQEAFEQAFGDDFERKLITSMGVATSPDGCRIGLAFTLADGGEVRVAMPTPWALEGLVGMLMRATETAILRAKSDGQG